MILNEREVTDRLAQAGACGALQEAGWQLTSGGMGTFEAFYLLALALWVGGMAIFTFLVTPAIFKSYGRDKAGEIVGKLLPGYFTYNLVLSVLAFVFFLLRPFGLMPGWGLPLALTGVALLVNAFHRLILYPAILAVKKTVPSFEADESSPVRKRFRKLHAASMALNLSVFTIGLILLMIEAARVPA